MPHTIFAPVYLEDGTRIIDQRRLRMMYEELTPEDIQRDHESLKAKNEAAKAARIQAKQREEEEKEFQAGAQAAAQYGIAPQALKPAGMGIAQMLDSEQAMNSEFEAKKQELAQKYQGYDAGNMARELDELHQKQDAELAAKFANNPMAEQVIGQRNQEFRAQAANWLQTEISSKQQQYFAAVDKKCNSALAAQLNGMQPQQITNALTKREGEMQALGRTPEQIQTVKQTLIGSYFQNLATSNPAAFLEATKQLQKDIENGEAGARMHEGAGNPNAPSLQNSAPNPLTDLAKNLPEDQLNKFSRLADRAQVTLEKKEKAAKITMQQQEIMQSLTGLDSEYQRTEIDKITASMEDREMADRLKIRLNLQLDYEERIKAAKDWETGDKIIAQDLEPLQKLEAISAADISEEAREALIREVMGDPTARSGETPENQQVALEAMLKIASGAIQSPHQLYAICQQQNLTRDQAGFLKQTLEGKGLVNGVPISQTIQIMLNQNPDLKENPGGLLDVTKKIVRDWPDGLAATPANIGEQAEGYIGLEGIGIPNQEKADTPINQPLDEPEQDFFSYEGFSEQEFETNPVKFIQHPVVRERFQETEEIDLIMGGLMDRAQQAAEQLQLLVNEGKVNPEEAQQLVQIALTEQVTTNRSNKLDGLIEDVTQAVSIMNEKGGRVQVHVRESDIQEALNNFEGDGDEFVKARQALRNSLPEAAHRSLDNQIYAYEQYVQNGMNAAEAAEFIVQNPDVAELAAEFHRAAEQNLDDMPEQEAEKLLEELVNSQGMQIILPGSAGGESGNSGSALGFMAGFALGALKEAGNSVYDILKLIGDIQMAPMDLAVDSLPESHTNYTDDNSAVNLLKTIYFAATNPSEFASQVEAAFDGWVQRHEETLSQPWGYDQGHMLGEDALLLGEIVAPGGMAIKGGRAAKMGSKAASLGKGGFARSLLYLKKRVEEIRRGSEKGLPDHYEIPPMNRETGLTVLGLAPRYEKLGNELNARFLKLSKKEWDSMSRAERWQRNSEFLEIVKLKGDEIVFSNRPFGIKDEWMFSQELEWLKQNGYSYKKWSKKVTRTE